MPYVERGGTEGEAPIPSPTAALPELEVVAQVGGTGWDVALTDRYAFVAAGSVIKVFDVSDAAHPRQVGQSRPLSGVAMSIAVDGSTAYVAVSSGYARHIPGAGLAVMDLTEPAHPRLVRTNEFPGGAMQVLVHRGYALLLGGNSWGQDIDRVVHVLDITVPDNPREVAHRDTSGSRMALDGDRLYVGGWGGGEVYDVTDPATIDAPVATFYPDGGYALAARGEQVFTTFGGLPADEWSEQLHVATLDMAERSFDVACRTSGEGVFALAWLAKQLLAIGATGGCIVDVTAGAAASPAVFEAPGYGTAVGVRGNFATVVTAQDPPGEGRRDFTDDGRIGVLMTEGAGITLLDTSDTNGLRVAGSVDGPPAWAVTAAGDGGRLFVAVPSRDLYASDDPMPLWVLDASDPASPVAQGSILLTGQPVAIAVDGQYAYVLTSAGLEVIDAGDPAHPRALAITGPGKQALHDRSYPMPRIVAVGGFVYAAIYRDLIAFDVHDPTAPKAVGLSTAGDVFAGATDIALAANGDAFLFAMRRYVQPVHVDDNGMHRAGETFEVPDALSIAWANGHLFVLRADFDSGTLGLDVMDVSQPGRPPGVASLDTLPSRPFTESVRLARITATDDRLYLIDDWAAVTALDISNPRQPAVVAYTTGTPFDRALFGEQGQDLVNTFAHQLDVAAWNGFVLRTSELGGLQILR